MKHLKYLIIGLLSIGLVGCSGNSDKEAKTYDTEFISSLSKGLQARWDIGEKYEDKEEEMLIGSEEHYDYYLKLVNAELEEVSKYKDLKFKDSKLQELALTYINLLNQQNEALQYLKVDYDKFYNQWQPAYNQRSQLIMTFKDNYNLTVPEKYKETLSELLTNAKLVNDSEQVVETINSLVDTIEFERVKEEFDWNYYEATVENTTSVDFEFFTLEINLLDKDGTIIESTYASVDNWKQGQKVKLEFSTDANFESIEFTPDYYIAE